MSDVVEGEEDGSSPLAAAAFLSRLTAAACSSFRSGGQPAHDDVQQQPWLQRRRPLPKGLGLRVRRHGGEEAVTATRGCGG
jgi:hypothetical protein